MPNIDLYLSKDIDDHKKELIFVCGDVLNFRDFVGKQTKIISRMII